MAMSSISSVQPGSVSVPTSPGSAGIATGELAKYESQLSDWVHCPSCKTSAGKAKIAEITAKIDAIKAEMKKVDDAKKSASATNQEPAQHSVAKSLRFDSRGTWVSTQA